MITLLNDPNGIILCEGVDVENAPSFRTNPYDSRLVYVIPYHPSRCEKPKEGRPFTIHRFMADTNPADPSSHIVIPHFASCITVPFECIHHGLGYLTFVGIHVQKIHSIDPAIAMDKVPYIQDLVKALMAASKIEKLKPILDAANRSDFMAHFQHLMKTLAPPLSF